jgi:diaminohydroxyphosphoribosylaminopyrimidine deaminase/5-amino-6-(5-phosphoribosylamino)uracil reductase
VPQRAANEAAFMQRALRLATRGQGYVEPNPMVGCVIVRRGEIIGEGYHRRFGGPHAEIEALRRCRSSPRGATVYVTLEPCCHFGKTPPCTEALIEAGVRRVVAALRDPTPQVAGRGARKLRAAGIRVETGLLARQAAELDAPFFKLMQHKRPWVILKWAQSLDGKIATRTGDAKWISDEPARAHAHRVRGRVDAILVGRKTVLADDPELTCRVGRMRRIATRIVLDAGLRTPTTARLVRGARSLPTWIIGATGAPQSRARALQAAGCVVHRVPRKGSQLSLPAILDLLGAHGMTNALVEGGGRLLGSFLDQRLADEFHIYVAPLLIGGIRAVSVLGGQGPATVREALRLPQQTSIRRLGSGWFIRVRPESGQPSKAGSSRSAAGGGCIDCRAAIRRARRGKQPVRSASAR